MAHPANDYSGGAFARPDSKFLSKAWRVQTGTFAPQVTLTPLVLRGQDSITAANLAKGLAVYAGYANGTYANLTAVKARVGSNPVVISITPNGEQGPRCFDVEPGDGTPDQTPAFVNYPNHGGPEWGQKDAGLPMIYCSAGDSQVVINALSSAGIAREKYLLWSAHWIGYHICAPKVCGYPAADGTQYASNNSFDSDAFYSYCFSTPTPPPPPPPASTYGAPKALTAVADTVAVNLAWAPPDTITGLPAASEYQVFLYKNVADKDHIVEGYPKTVTELKSTVEVVHGDVYIVHVVASGPSGTHVKPDTYVSVSFTV